VGNKNGLEQLHNKELDNKKEGWDNILDKEDILKQDAKD
jgi:hypothetical protein